MKKLIPLIFFFGIGCSKEDIKPVDGRWDFGPSIVYSISGSFTITKSGSSYNFSDVVVGDGFYPATMEYSNKNVVLKFQRLENRWTEITLPFSYNGNNITFKNSIIKDFDSASMTNVVGVYNDPKIIATRVP